jgi:hypothetical protein
VHYNVFTTTSGRLSLVISSAVRREMSHLLGHQVSKAIQYFYVVLLVILGLHRLLYIYIYMREVQKLDTDVADQFWYICLLGLDASVTGHTL